MRVLRSLPTVLGVYEGVYVLHGPGSVQRDHRSHIAERRWLKALYVAGHARPLHLEYADRLAPREQFEGLLVVQWYLGQFYPVARASLHEVAGTLKDR